MDTMAILMATIPITMVMDIPLVIGATITEDQGMDPVMGDEIIGVEQQNNFATASFDPY